MKAVHFEKHGESDVLRYGEVPEPQAAPGSAVIRVRACALNYLDIWVRRGWPGLKLEMPHWCGADVAGEIAELGAGVSGWSVGQRVVADPGINRVEDEFTRRGEASVSPGYRVLGEHVRGGAAEYVAVPAANLEEIPPTVGFAEAAAPLLVGLTAWRMLIHRARLRAGESVLVVGAGGGVNSMSIQVAKLAGAYVIAVAGSALKADKARGLGADAAIDRSVRRLGEGGRASDRTQGGGRGRGQRRPGHLGRQPAGRGPRRTHRDRRQHQRAADGNRPALPVRQAGQPDRQHHGQSSGLPGGDPPAGGGAARDP